MQALEEENIAAYKYMEEGNFRGSLAHKPHSRIPFDQVTETTINQSCKDAGGLSRNIQNPSATERCAKIQHHDVVLRECPNKKIKKND